VDRHVDVDDNLLIVIDQFEEVFRFKNLAETVGPDSRASAVEDAADFVRLLLTSLNDDRVHIVITMRSEFLGPCAQFDGLPEEINKGQYLIPRLTPEEQREIIVRPVWARRAQISELLVQRLLDDVGPEPEQLPILQHVLARLWQDSHAPRQGKATLDVCNYENIGGFGQAMDRHAKRIYDNLPDDKHRWVTKRLFQRITLKGTSDRPVRRPRTITDIQSVVCDAGPGANEFLAKVIREFSDPQVGFLTSPDGRILGPNSVIDISHESLCWLWSTLEQWVQTEADAAEVYSRVSKGALLYRNREQDAFREGLYADPALTFVLTRYRPGEASGCSLTVPDPWSQPWSVIYNNRWQETIEYLQDSKAAIEKKKAEEERRLEEERQRKEDERKRVDEERRKEEQRIEKEQRQKQLRRNWLMVIGGVLLGLLIVCGIFYVLLGRTIYERVADGLASQSIEQAKQWGGGTQERAALLDIKSIQLQTRPDNTDVIAWEDFQRITEGRPIEPLNQRPASVFVVPDLQDARLFLVVSVMLRDGWTPGRSIIIRSDSHNLDRSFEAELGGPLWAISGSGRYVFSECFKGNLWMWDRIVRGERRRIACAQNIASVIEAPDSEHFALVEYQPKGKPPQPGQPVPSTLRVFNASGEMVCTPFSLVFMNGAFSKSGFDLAVVYKKDKQALLDVWRLTTHPERTLVLSVAAVADAAPLDFSDRFLAIGMSDGTVKLYEPAKGNDEVVLGGEKIPQHGGQITSVAFSRDSRLLATAGQDSVVRVLEFRDGDGWPKLRWSDDFAKPVSQLVFSKQADWLGLAVGDNTARVKYAETGFETVRVTHLGRVNSIAFSPKGSQFISASRDEEETDNSVASSEGTDERRNAAAASGKNESPVLESSSHNANPPPAFNLNCDQVARQAQPVSLSEDGQVVAVSCLLINYGPSTSKSLPSENNSPGGSAAFSLTPVAKVYDLNEPMPQQLTGSLIEKAIVNHGATLDNPNILANPCKIALSGHGGIVASICDNNLVLYDLKKKAPSISTALPAFSSKGSGYAIVECQHIPTSLAISSDGSTLAVGDGCGRLLTYRVSDGSLQQVGHLDPDPSLPRGSQAITALAFNQPATMVAIGNSYGNVWIESIDGKTAIHPRQRMTGSISTLSFGTSKNADSGARLIVGSGVTATVFDVGTWKPFFHVNGSSELLTVSFMNEKVALGYDNGRIDIFVLRPRSREDQWESGVAKVITNYDPWSLPLPEINLRLRGATPTIPVYAVRLLEADDILVATDETLPFAKVDSQGRQSRLSLQHHKLDVFDKAHQESICRNLRKDIKVGQLSYSDVCTTKDTR
jgi:WD40 repeat protein